MPLSADAPTHGIATYGDLKYPADFKHFDYVNPNAPKGGVVKLGWFGSYDNFNPFIIKGTAAMGSGGLHCTLLSSSDDEPMSSYGYLAEKVELAPDRKSVVFTLNGNAKFSDGTPVTSEDVVFSFDTLIKKGSPIFAQYYKDVKSVEKISQTQVRFIFSTDKNRELPVILGQLPVFSKAYYTKNDFEKTDLNPPVGCGPFKISDYKPGQSVSYVRVPNWWAENIPSHKGLNNFDVTYVYYRDQNVMFEAFKAGDHDFRTENIAKNWVKGYTIDSVKDGRMIKKENEYKLPLGIQAFFINNRKPLFADRKLRQALSNAFDFEWANKNLFFNTYTRSSSYFNNSVMASKGLPQGEELKVLDQFKDELPPELFTKEFKLPVTNGSGNDRRVISQADKLLKEAGWVIKDGKRVNQKTGAPLTFEFLINDPSIERVALAYQRNLETLGIDLTIRNVTVPQYIERMNTYDFDMTLLIIPESETPGNEQRGFWGSKYADVNSSQNYAGIKNPVIDKIVELIVDSPDRPTLTARVQALDRVLLWGYYTVPTYYSKTTRYAYWNKFGMPGIKPKDGVGFSAWWVDPALEKKLNR
jgi:microcin C transport system substrate-binding protein